MTPETEDAWLASARGRNLRDIEELVAGHKKGETPDAEKNPELVKRRRVLELSPRVDALVEQCRAVLANELGSHVDDEVLVEALCRRFLAGDTVAGSTDGNDITAETGKAAKLKVPRPAHRIIIYQCASCARAWQQGRGQTVELTEAELALAECDGETVQWVNDSSPHDEQLGTPKSEQLPSSQDQQLASPQGKQRAAREPWRPLDHVVDKQRASKNKRRAVRTPARTGDHDADEHASMQSRQPAMLEPSRSVTRLVDAPATPEIEPPSMPRLQQRITPDLSQRAKPNIPQRIRNLVWARDGGRCRVPGCRATRCLDIHHIRPRSEGGDHDPANLAVLCSGHHKLLHAGLLTISGDAPDHLVFTRGGKVLVDALAPSQANASEVLHQRTATSKFADVTRRERAKQAVAQLGYKARVAGAAIDAVIAHVDSDADVGAIVKAALARGTAPQPKDNEDSVALARQALVRLGFSSAAATEAVKRASAHVGTAVELADLIKEALRWCR